MNSLLDSLYDDDGQSRNRKFTTYEDGTPDPTKYHDPSEAHFLAGEGTQSLASVLPRSKGLRGVVIPRSGPGGGSLGFNAQMPVPVYIDPEMTQRQICVDYSKLTADEINSCITEANQSNLSESRDRGVLAYALMSKLCTSHRKTASSKPVLAPDPVAAPIVKTATPRKEIRPDPVSLMATLADATFSSPGTNTAATQMLKKVLFEMPRPIGQFTGYYHDVIRTDDLLILVYDHNQGKAQHVWFPQCPATEDDEDQSEFAVLVYDEDGQPDTVFSVVPTPGRFTYLGVEFCLLAISKEKSYKAQPQVNSHGV